MKPIRKLTEPTEGLKKYLADDADKAEWRRFRRHDGGTAYKDLQGALVSLQHGLCGYCEIDLRAGIDCQIEHIVPRSNPVEGVANTFNPSNLIACCEGGTRENVFGPNEKSSDAERFLPPLGENTSCGQKKKCNTIPGSIDPTKLPALPPLFRVGLNGEMTADENGCSEAGIAVESVANVIVFLGLNVPRLRQARENYLNALEENEHLDNPRAVLEEARQALLPDENCNLQKFFTTSRSYFAQLGEKILAEPPQPWI